MSGLVFPRIGSALKRLASVVPAMRALDHAGANFGCLAGLALLRSSEMLRVKPEQETGFLDVFVGQFLSFTNDL